MSAHAERKSFVVSMTLTELMFLLFFLLLLAAVHRLVNLERDLGKARENLAYAENQRSALREKIDTAKAGLSPSPPLSDEAFFELVNGAVVPSGVSIRDHLSSLKSQLTEARNALTEEQWANAEASARATQLEREIADVRSSDDNSAAGLRECESVTSSLRGQVMNCQSRLGNGGMDHPPCWADPNTGKVEYLLEVTMQDDGIIAIPAWPAHRAAAAASLPDLMRLVESKRDPQAFLSLGQPILAWSNRQDPACRHYVRILDRTTSIELHKRARFAIESVFYKYEVR